MSKHPTLFITHRSTFHQQAALEAAPRDLDITMVRTPTHEQVLELINGKEFLITERSGSIDTEVIRAGKDLRLIQRLGSQTQDIDLDAAHAAGIPVCYLPIRTCINVAEHLLMLMLGVARRSPELHQITLSGENYGQEPTRCTEDFFSYNWSKVEEVRTIWQSTVGILGMGEIGFELARRLRGFDCTVLYNKRNRLPEHTERELNVGYASKDDLVSTCDFVVSMLPLLPDTGECLDQAFYDQMKPGAIFISAGGSGTINEEDLAATIKSKKLFGVGVDNFTWEPVRKDCPLLAPARDVKANVLLTPHVAAGTVPSSQKDLRINDYQNIANFLNGKELAYRII